MWHRKAMDKGIVEAMATKFSDNFAISMLKKHRKFCRRGLTHLDATTTFKNRSDTYETPCILMWLAVFPPKLYIMAFDYICLGFLTLSYFV